MQAFMTLDGVVQAPGGPDEDAESGFTHGGWSSPYDDEDFAAAVAGWFGNADAYLFGRKTYDIFNAFWSKQTDPDNPVAAQFNTLPKYVATRSSSSFEWNNSHAVGDVASEVAALKGQPGRELQVHGSFGLIQTLIEHDLIDEYRLLYFPVHLGTGKRLFEPGGRAAALRLTSSTTTAAGVVISTYEPAGPVRYGSWATG